MSSDLTGSILGCASFFRKVAQSVRHAPGLRRWTGMWDLLRRPYARALTLLSGQTGLPLQIGGDIIRLNPMFANLNWETVEVEAYRAFRTAVKPGDTVYDVGAHFGTYTIISIHQGGPETRVIAYEPCELTRQYLTQHLKWNRVAGQVLVRGVCCGATRGKASFYFRPGVPEGINGLVRNEGLSEVPVEVTTLDAEVDELGLRPAIIKIDVEGAELDVLRGAELTLRNCRPRLFISLHPGPLATLGIQPSVILDWLDKRAYRCHIIAEDQELHVMALPA
jgi:FkbM family methyltransferase